MAIFAQLYHWEYTDAMKDVCLSTVFSIVTLPLIAALSGLIWQPEAEWIIIQGREKGPELRRLLRDSGPSLSVRSGLQIRGIQSGAARRGSAPAQSSSSSSSSSA